MPNKYIMGLVGKGTTTVSGNDTKLQLWGLYHLVGSVVSVFIIGTDAGDYTVAADGSVTVEFYGTSPTATTNSGVTLANIIANAGSVGESDCEISVVSGGITQFLTIPVVIGLGFVSQGQVLRAATEADVKSPSGAALGKLRRAYQFGVLVRESVNVQFGTSLTPSPLGNMDYATFSTMPDERATPIGYGVTFSGVYWSQLNDSDGYDSMICWQQDRPWPTTICAVSTFLESAER